MAFSKAVTVWSRSASVWAALVIAPQPIQSTPPTNRAQRKVLFNCESKLRSNLAKSLL